ncbi:MAG: ABC transporter ATP-binding protein [Flavobacteriaceae bacterium]
MEYIKKLWRFIIPYKTHVYLNIFFNILYALSSSLMFVALVPIFNTIFKKDLIEYQKPTYTSIFELNTFLQDFQNYYIYVKIKEDGHYTVLLFFIGIIITLALLKSVFGYLGLYFATYLRNGVLVDIRKEMFRKLINNELAYFSEKTKGDSISRVTTDSTLLKNTFLSLLEIIIKEPLTIIFSLSLMLAGSPSLTLFVFVFVPVVGFLISLVGKSLKRKSTKVQVEAANTLAVLEESLYGLKAIKSYNSENTFYNKYQSSINKFYKLSNKLMNRNNLASPMTEFLGILVIGSLLLYGGRLVFIEKTLDASVFVGFLGLAYNIITPAKAIAKASFNIKKGNAAAERILDVIDREDVIKEHPEAIEKSTFDNNITIDRVSFKYEDDYVLNDFSITIPKGKTVALVGQSGSGKSTIANLLTRFYDINSGHIKIDGIDIAQLKKSSVRHLTGLVTQDSILFNDTIKQNILLGNENASDEEIIDALKIANAWEFVSELPNGINTNIGDGGGKLSGGQQQRISIARAVLKNAPIMILDEATSALDTESERAVQIALENMMRNRTSIVIAHRLSTIKNADSIIVMKKGQIVEQGTHHELLAKNGMYKTLVEMQNIA